MAGFLKIRYNANGLLKNRIINTDSIDLIEPFSAPGGRYVAETRARIFTKDGTKYDMSLTIDEIQKLLREAGVVVAEIQSMPPEHPVKSVTAPAAPIAFYKRSTLIKPQQPGTTIVKQAQEGTRKPVPAAALVKKDTSGSAKAPESARKEPETVQSR